MTAEFGFHLKCHTATVAVGALTRAWVLRVLGLSARLKLPPVRRSRRLSPECASQVVAWVESIARVMIFWRRQRCFYRSYAIACVLRGWNLPLVLNLGYRNLRDPKNRHSHCWLTLGGNLFFEAAETQSLYPIEIGRVGDEVCYWLGEDSLSIPGTPSAGSEAPRVG